jgi:hypothetical protein
MEIRDKIILLQLVKTYNQGCVDAVSGNLRGPDLAAHWLNVSHCMIQEVVCRLDCSVREAEKVIAETMIETGCWE